MTNELSSIALLGWSLSSRRAVENHKSRRKPSKPFWRFAKTIHGMNFMICICIFLRDKWNRVVAESCSENLTIGSHFRELPSLTIEYWLPDCECSSKSQDIDSETYANYFFVLIGLLWNSQQDSELKERGSKGLNIKWSLYMSWNHPNLTHCKKWLQGSQNLTHF